MVGALLLLAPAVLFQSPVAPPSLVVTVVNAPVTALGYSADGTWTLTKTYDTAEQGDLYGKRVVYAGYVSPRELGWLITVTFESGSARCLIFHGLDIDESAGPSTGPLAGTAGDISW